MLRMTKLRNLFPDMGMALSVLDGLLRAGRIEPAQLTGALDGIAAENFGLHPEDQCLDIEAKRASEALRRLGEFEIDEAALAAVDVLNFDGGNWIYWHLESAIDIDTGGEESWYQLNSLQGVRGLGGLAEINLDGYGYRDQPLDLAPLAGHPALETFIPTGLCSNADALESVSKLKTLDLRFGAKLDPADVAERLRERGVTVPS